MAEFFRPPDPMPPSPARETEVPVSLRRDHQIRAAMERAVTLDNVAVTELTKELSERGIAPLHAITLERPFIMPHLGKPGSNNAEMRAFAFDACDALAAHFSAGTWDNWFVAPYFTEGDDTQVSFRLGVFVTDDFSETVVE